MKKIFLLLLLLCTNHKTSCAQNVPLHIQYLLPTKYENTDPLVLQQKILSGPWFAANLAKHHFKPMVVSLINDLSEHEQHSPSWQIALIKGLMNLSVNYHSPKSGNNTTIHFADFLALRKHGLLLNAENYKYFLKKEGRLVSVTIAPQNNSRQRRSASSASSNSYCTRKTHHNNPT